MDENYGHGIFYMLKIKVYGQVKIITDMNPEFQSYEYQLLSLLSLWHEEFLGVNTSMTSLQMIKDVKPDWKDKSHLVSVTFFW